jgi:hypothetical protein
MKEKVNVFLKKGQFHHIQNDIFEHIVQKITRHHNDSG